MVAPRPRRHTVAAVVQHDTNPFELSVACEVFGLDRRSAMDRARDILRLVGLEDRERAYPSELSGGMQQRAALSRVLVVDPQIILMDEPFGAIDEFTRERLNLELLRIWEERGQTIIFVTHSIYEAVFLSTRVVVMAARPGRILAEVSIDEPHPRSDAWRVTQKFAAYAKQLSEHLAEASSRGAIDL